MVERGPEKAGVGGSIPSLGINLPNSLQAFDVPFERFANDGFYHRPSARACAQMWAYN